MRSSLALSLALAACAERVPPPPSVILISIDTLRADHLGFHGYERATSPFLDAFAARGIVFEHAFTPAAWTLIAHMSMLTGFYPEQHGVVEGDLALSPDVPLLAERLQAAGYQTLGFYQPTWVHPRHGFARGFDVFREHANAEQAGEHVFEELARLSDERPFFLFVHLFDVHSDPATQGTLYSAPPPFQELFVPGAAERMAGHTYLELKHRDGFEAREVADMIALYDESIRHVDSALEGWFARLESEGRLAESCVIVTSDHGESLAQRGRLGGHGGPWQEGLHVPLVVRLPRDARAGERVSAPVHLIDLAPTVLELAGLRADPLLPGVSLLAPLAAERVLIGANPPLEYTVQWPLKFVRRKHLAARFDLAQDPLEKAVQGLLPEEYTAQRSSLKLPPATLHRGVPIGALSAADAEALRDLGYAGEVEDE